jgi:MoxR-like ATPase
MGNLVERFTALADALNAEHVERHGEIDCALLALVSGSTFFMLGEPGQAKSQLVRRIALRIRDVEWFDLHLDSFSTPDDVFGPRSLAAMQEGRWERETAGTLVTAQLPFLDEIFKANGSLLNALLLALNERLFRQGTEVIDMPWSTLFAAANEIPEGPRLGALYDRLLIRRQLRRIQDTGGFVAMLQLDPDPKPEKLLSWADVLQAQQEAARLPIRPAVFDATARIRAELADRGLFPTDRRFRKAMDVVRAQAWLDGSPAAEPEHLACLSDILWDRPEQIATVATAVDEVVEPMIRELDALLRDLEQLKSQVNPHLPDPERKVLANEMFDKQKLATRDLAALAARLGDHPRHKRKVALAENSLLDLKAMIFRDLFQSSLDAPPKGRRRGS